MGGGEGLRGARLNEETLKISVARSQAYTFQFQKGALNERATPRNEPSR